MNEKEALDLIDRGEEKTGLFAMSYDSSDAYGSVMSHWFGIATVLFVWGEEIPESWDFRPHPLLNHGSNLDQWPDEEYLHMLEDGVFTADDLLHDGNLFCKYRQALVEAELDY